jgi:glycosyltransferase involved in cell wall biosynthesis
MDIYGDYLTIIQASRYRGQTNRGISTAIAFMHRVLQKGDVFSVCSTTQSHALVGELAMAGRLNFRTFGYQFTRIILPGSPPAIDMKNGNGQRVLMRRRLGLSDDTFLVLWCGGYNTWTDIKTLFSGLIWAIEREPKVHFLSIGASTYNSPNNVYAQFLKLIEQSHYRDHFHMLGWRPWEEINDFYFGSDVGINIDALHYETIYGTRTRLVEMISAGLPVITTLGTELSSMLGEGKIAYTFEIGDSVELGKNILKLARNPEIRQQMSSNAYSFAQNDLSFSNTTIPVREWIQSPYPAPDKGEMNFRNRLHNVEYLGRTLLRQAVWDMFGQER